MGVAGARDLQRSGSGLARFFGRMIEPSAINPSRFLRREGVYAAGAGVGAGTGRELVSDGDPETNTTAELIADLVGSLAGYGAVAGGQAIGRSARDVGAAIFSPENFATDLARQEAASSIGTASRIPPTPSGTIDTGGLAGRIASLPRIGDTVLGFEDTLADVTRNPTIADLQFGRAQNNPAFGRREAENQQVAAEALEEVAPNDARPGQYSSEASNRRDDISREIEEYLAETQDDFNSRAETLRPRRTAEDRGRTIRGSLQEQEEQAREIERRAWSGIVGEVNTEPLARAFDRVPTSEADSIDTISDVRSLLNIPRRMAGDEPEADGLQTLIAKVFGEDVDDAAGNLVNFQEIVRLRSRLSAASRAARSAGDRDKARLVDMYIDEVDSFISRELPDQAQEIEQARAISRDLNDRFTRPGDPVAEVLRQNEGRPRVPDSSVPGRFINPDRGQASYIDRLLNETGNSEDVRQSLTDHMIEEVRRRGLIDKPQQLRRFISEYDQVFQRFPELRKDLGNVAALRDRVSRAEGQASSVQRELFSSSGGPVGRYLSFGDEQADTAMKRVLSSRDPAAEMDELLRFVDDAPEAVEGAKAAFWDVIRGRARSKGISTRNPTGQNWKFQELYNFVNNPANAAVMERLYQNDPEHLEKIRLLADTLQNAEFQKTGRQASGTRQGFRAADAAPTVESLQSRLYSVKRGVVGPGYTLVSLGSVMARKLMRGRYSDQFNRILDEALLDPDVASLLLQEYNPANIEALNRWAKGAGIAQVPEMISLIENEESEEMVQDAWDDEFEEAIQR